MLAQRAKKTNFKVTKPDINLQKYDFSHDFSKTIITRKLRINMDVTINILMFA